MNSSPRFLRGSPFLVLAVVTVSTLAQQPAPRPAVPVEPSSAILDVFRSHPVVALGLGRHGNDQGLAFLLSLIRNPRFASIVNDVVVESGNPLYQDLMDRFVYGDEVADAALAQVWLNTTQAQNVLDGPLSGELFRTVRAINASLPAGRRIRVLLGDPPIDWDSVRNRSDHQKFMEMRDSYPADLIRREVLARQRRALVVYGQMHLQRKQLLANYDTSHPLAQTIVSLLENPPAIRVFTIWGNTDADAETLQADVVSWPTPSLAILRGSVLGAVDFTLFYPFATNRFEVRDGKLVPISRDQWRSMRMEDQFDALLYLGPKSSITVSRPSLARCSDAAYMDKRLRRLALIGLQGALDQLKKDCAGAIPK